MEKIPLIAESIPPDTKKSLYPEPFASLVTGREKRKLGDFFGLTNFGINLTSLAPGAISALLHHHAKQDEFLYILEGTPTLVTMDKEYLMNPGDCFGVKGGSGVACQLVNKSDQIVKYLEIGDRTPGDAVEYPNDDLKAVSLDNGQWSITHKDGRPY
jgi:uncharacterized cupin superfamily protein